VEETELKPAIMIAVKNLKFLSVVQMGTGIIIGVSYLKLTASDQ
jgi:hypothetical protein